MAAKLQRKIRRAFGASFRARLKAQMQEATLIIQCCWRRYFVRKKYVQLLLQLRLALCLQNLRSRQTGKSDTDLLKKVALERISATTLQRCWRGMITVIRCS